MHLQSTPQKSNVYPIRLGTSEEFHSLREELPRLGFIQENMEGHFHLRHISEAEFEVHAKGGGEPSAFRTLAALFLQGKSLETVGVQQAVGDRTFALLNSLGLIEQHGSSGRSIATSLAEAQRVRVEQTKFDREQFAAASSLVDSGQLLQAVAVLDCALQRAPGNSELERLRSTVRGPQPSFRCHNPPLPREVRYGLRG